MRSRAGAAGAVLIVAALTVAGCGDGSSEAPGAGSGGDAPTGGGGGGTGGSTGGNVATGATPGSGGDPATGGTPSSGGDATSSGGSGAITAEEFPARLAEATCSARVRCCAAVDNTLEKESCLEFALDTLTTRVHDPLVVFDPSRVSGCLDRWELAGASCLRRDFEDATEVCRVVAAGAVPDEGACTIPDQCAEPEAGYVRGVKGADEGVGHCHQEPDRALGEMCGLDFHRAVGGYCTNAGICEAKKPDGAACSEEDECLGACADGWCMPAEAAGDVAKFRSADCLPFFGI